MFYKSKSIASVGEESKFCQLCYYNGHYYFEADEDADWAEGVSQTEFNEAIGNVEIVQSARSEDTPIQLDNIEQTQLIMMEAMADQYEEAQARALTSMEVQATIYEELMAMKGEA